MARSRKRRTKYRNLGPRRRGMWSAPLADSLKLHLLDFKAIDNHRSQSPGIDSIPLGVQGMSRAPRPCCDTRACQNRREALARLEMRVIFHSRSASSRVREVLSNKVEVFSIFAALRLYSRALRHISTRLRLRYRHRQRHCMYIPFISSSSRLGSVCVVRCSSC